MEKQTKNIITREWAEKELRFYNTANIRYTVVCLSVIILVCGGMIAFISPFIMDSYEKVWDKVIFAVAFGGIMTAPVWFVLPQLIRSIKERKWLKNGDFEIVTRPLLYKEDKLVRYKRSTQEVFHFEGFDEVWAGHTDYQLAAMGDEFYIVHYKGSKKAQMVFSLKMYQYKEK